MNKRPSQTGENVFDARWMVKQFVGKVRERWCDFFVFETGDPRFYLFAQLDHWGCQTTLQFPVEKKRLHRDWKKNLIV